MVPAENDAPLLHEKRTAVATAAVPVGVEVFVTDPDVPPTITDASADLAAAVVELTLPTMMNPASAVLADDTLAETAAAVP